MGMGIPGAVRRTLLVGTVAILAACSGAAATPAATDAPAATPAVTSPATAAPSPAGSKDLILATTTSTQDSGLLDVLVPAFEKASGYTVKTVAVGSGQAIKMGEEGNADVLLVHSPAAEKEFVARATAWTARSSCTTPSWSSARGRPCRDQGTDLRPGCAREDRRDAGHLRLPRRRVGHAHEGARATGRRRAIDARGRLVPRERPGHGRHAPDRVREGRLHPHRHRDVAGRRRRPRARVHGHGRPVAAQPVPRHRRQPREVAEGQHRLARTRSPTSCSRPRARR